MLLRVMSDSIRNDLTLKQLDKIAALHSLSTYVSKADRVQRLVQALGRESLYMSLQLYDKYIDKPLT